MIVAGLVTTTSSGACRVTPLRPVGRTYATTHTVVRAASGVVPAHEDVTARKQAEEALREQTELLNLAHDAIIVRDPQSTITFWNRGAERLYGWSAAQAVGQLTHRLLQTRFPASPAEMDACLRRDGLWSGELVHTTRDGRQIVVESHQALRRCRVGGIRRYMATWQMRAGAAMCHSEKAAQVAQGVVDERDRVHPAPTGRRHRPALRAHS
jgi:PAS domain S-box-containing protein